MVEISAAEKKAHKVALKRISECERSGSKTLDLVGLGLSSIPSEIGVLSNLEVLRASYNALTNIPSEIECLNNLVDLSLSHNNFFELPRSLPKLKNLKKLNLEGNPLVFLSSDIGSMKNLEYLDFQLCELVSIPSEFGDLESLSFVNLSSNKFTSFPDVLFKLKNIKEIIFEGNSIAEIPKGIGSLNGLRVLDVSDNNLKCLPSDFDQLTSLNVLSLHNNKFEVFPLELCSISSLEKLYIGSNEIEFIPAGIDKLSNLIDLYAFNNRLNNLPPELFRVNALQHLHLGGNKIVEVGSGIGRLSNLRELFLGDNKISELPSQLGMLKNLEMLSIDKNNISALPSEIASLNKLVEIDASDNVLVSIPDYFENLSFLRKINFNNNHLTSLPDGIGKIDGLSELYLHENNLINLPASLRGVSNLRYLTLHGNPALKLSPNILGPHPSRANQENLVSAKSVLDYYFEAMRGNTRPLNEVKLILVGRGGAGKTSTVQALQGLEFNEGEESTPGIALCDWTMAGCKGAPITAHIWDFAGQVITHSLHQFFFSVRSVYVIVLTGRENSERDDAEYWLRLIQAFGTDDLGNSPSVVVALNKWDKVGCRPSIDREALQERYPFIQGFVEVDCKTKKGVSKLRTALCRAVEKLPWVREPFPARWDDVRRELGKKTKGKVRAHLTYSEYRALCEKFDVSDSGEQDSLAEILHNLGAALNYRNDPRLREATVLQPEWLTKNVYSLIRRAERKAGVLLQSDVDIVLRTEKDLEMRTYLLQIMERFEIAYAIRAENNIVERWLVPQALPDRQPKGVADFAATIDATRLRYSYAALPEGLVARAVVRLHDLIEVSNDALLQWASGVILTREGARALLRAEPQDRQVTITVTGPIKARQQLAGLCQLEMREIHSEIRGLDPLEETMYSGEWVAVNALEEDERQGRKTGIPTRTKGTIVVDPTEINNAYSEKSSRDDFLWKPTVFICYSKSNLRQRQQLEIQLKLLKNEGLLDGAWHDRMIDPGDHWDGKIQSELNGSDIFIFLASADALATDYIIQYELPRALELQASGKTILIPIVIETCRWKTWNKGALGALNALPEKAKPINKWKPHSDAWSSIADGLEVVCRKLVDKKH